MELLVLDLELTPDASRTSNDAWWSASAEQISEGQAGAVHDSAVSLITVALTKAKAKARPGQDPSPNTQVVAGREKPRPKTVIIALPPMGAPGGWRRCTCMSTGIGTGTGTGC